MWNELEHIATKVRLSRALAYILVGKDPTKVTQLEGLDPGVLPVELIERTYTIRMIEPAGTNGTVHRSRVAIPPVYKFTEDRARGQTPQCVIVDIGKVPTGNLTPFKAHDALSRSAGRDSIRVLPNFNDKLFIIRMTSHQFAVMAHCGWTKIRYKM